MTNPNLLQQALDALERNVQHKYPTERNKAIELGQAAIAALRTELAAVQGEPEPENRCIRELKAYALANPETWLFPGWDGRRVTKYLADTTPQPASQQPEQIASNAQDLQDGFRAGWAVAAAWAIRDDLLADIGSPAYLKDMAKVLSQIPIAQPEQPATSEVTDAAIGLALRAWHSKLGYSDIEKMRAALESFAATSAKPAQGEVTFDEARALVDGADGMITHGTATELLSAFLNTRAATSAKPEGDAKDAERLMPEAMLSSSDCLRTFEYGDGPKEAYKDGWNDYRDAAIASHHSNRKTK